MKIEAWILEQLSKANFKISIHAAVRMNERFITEADIKSCGRTAKFIKFQTEKKTWKVIGKDLDKNTITVVCSIKDNILIVTVY